MENYLSKKCRALRETPEETGVSEDYFYRMLSPQALHISAPYNKEEGRYFKKFFKSVSPNNNMNLVAIGAGELWFLPIGMRYGKHYVAVEPLADVYINNSVNYLIKQLNNVTVVGKKFNNLKQKDLPQGNSCFVFLFNIFSYLEDPVKTINKLIKPGDSLFLSAWNDTEAANDIRTNYFNYLNRFETKAVVDPEKTGRANSIANFPFQELKYYKSHKRKVGKVTDILTIHI